MTRGLKGCYVYCTDTETTDYFCNKLGIEGTESGVFFRESDVLAFLSIWVCKHAYLKLLKIDWCDQQGDVFPIFSDCAD